MSPSDIIAELKGRLSEFLGPEQISNRPELLEQYSSDKSFEVKGSPFLAVFPVRREQLQSIIKLACESHIPLVPVSSGAPHFRGDTIPEQDGILMDFSRMAQVIKIDGTTDMPGSSPV
jgi:glycolate oxidase